MKKKNLNSSSIALSDIQKIVEVTLQPIQVQMGNMNKKIDKLDSKVDKLENTVDRLEKKTEKGFKETKDTLNTVIEYFEENEMKIDKRVNRIENHLSLPSLS